MITYKNISYSAKTFYGVKFAPGDIKSVPGYINCRGMVRVFPAKATVVNSEISDEPTISKRGRKKQNDPSKVSFAETQEVKIETSEEETSNGNNS